MRFDDFIVPGASKEAPAIRAGRGCPGDDGEKRMQLVKYEAACRALAEAKSFDEVKEFKNRAEAARAYARQAKNKQLELDSLEIRVRAERRLGEMIIELKDKKILRVQGVRDYTTRGQESPLRLADIGVDSEDSGIAQRLAKLPPARFEQEISEWRSDAEVSRRVEVPLQVYRIPTIRADRAKAAHRNGRDKIDPRDPLDVFRSPDGRRIADWRASELARLEAIFDRAARCARRLRNEMPVANPDPFATCEMLFEVAALARLLNEEFSDSKIPPSDGGLQADQIAASRARRSRLCEQCKLSFTMSPKGNTAGRFCSRECSTKHRRARSAG